ncbi:serine hydrolase domain-containing protein [Streptomyces sp. CBMA123]|uniref:serine hydrolase domain-containing protein n=1 Tax=Streptomyces sp. CBMA123 TaxID=1896313 RepID=UPI001662142B|nr:serine hydrolase domain-containing protein [Streptomyces sp. CBMA123]MBD0691737.1 serine hydrolase [Streptomyces sp. CBMA123]
MREQTWQKRSRRRTVSAVAALAIGVVTAGVLAPSAAAAPRPDSVQRGLNALVQSDGLPGALASVQDGTGRTRSYTAGVGDLATGAKVPKDGQVRIGSNTKTFTAVVALQLVGEGRIGLDEPVETYLPGIVRGDGIDGGHITVRELLQHTSGLPDYEGDIEESVMQQRYFEPRELLDLAFRHKADFPPGKRFGYSSTNYVLVGLIVQKVTGRPLAEEIDRRVIQRIGLRHTYFPAVGDRTIREAHPKGYRQEKPGGPLIDTTELDPSAGWAAGQLTSTDSDLNRFFSALLAGDLLPPAQLAQMRTTVPIGDTGAGYGLGIISRPLSCGGVYWGHGGDIPGYESRGGATDDGRAADITVTSIPADGAVTRRLESVVDAALCR